LENGRITLSGNAAERAPALRKSDLGQ